MIDELTMKDNVILPNQMHEMLSSEESSMVIIDLRNPYEFAIGNIGDAINIPVSEILSEENISFFKTMQKNSVEIIFYGKDQLEANGPWMLMRQIGFDNISILAGGYNCFINMEPGLQKYVVEQPVMDFSAFINTNELNKEILDQNQKKPVQIIPVRRKKKNVTAGGC